MRTADTPIACTLSPADLPDRLSWIRQVTNRHLLSHTLDGRILRLTYHPEAKPELERIVAGERACCGFLDYKLESGPSTTVLTIYAPSNAEAADAQWLFEQFLPQSTSPKRCGCATGGCG